MSSYQQSFPSIHISPTSSTTSASPSSSPSTSPTESTSTETAASVDTTTSTRPQPGPRTRSSSLLHKNVLSRMRPLPFQYVFSLHHTRSTTSAHPSLLVDLVPDIATFYKIHNNFPFDSLALKDGVHFFRAGVKPLWEDDENLNGGCWTVKVRREEGRALRTWEELCLMVLGGELQASIASERDHVLGISYSPRLYFAHISIWTKNGDNRNSIEALQRTAVSRLSADLRPTSETDYYYKKHTDHSGWKHAIKQESSNSRVG